MLGLTAVASLLPEGLAGALQLVDNGVEQGLAVGGPDHVATGVGDGVQDSARAQVLHSQQRLPFKTAGMQQGASNKGCWWQCMMARGTSATIR